MGKPINPRSGCREIIVNISYQRTLTFQQALGFLQEIGKREGNVNVTVCNGKCPTGVQVKIDPYNQEELEKKLQLAWRLTAL